MMSVGGEVKQAVYMIGKTWVNTNDGKENNLKVVAIKDMSDGNESVGEMWKETKIFDGSTPVIEIVEWAKHPNADLSKRGIRKNLIITVPQDQDD